MQWEAVARDTVAVRIEAGRNPHDAMSELVGELSTRSDEFATLWAAHNVKIHTTATKTLRHAVVGELELTAPVTQSTPAACAASAAALVRRAGRVP